MAKMKQPVHVPSKPVREKKHPPPALQQYQSPKRRDNLSNSTTNLNFNSNSKEQKEEAVSSGDTDYSQTSNNSADLREIDRSVEQHQAEKQKRRDSADSFEF